MGERNERGTTVVEFLGVTLLVAAGVLVLLQMALWVWCRNVTVNAADEGARTAAELGRPLADGEARTRSVLRDGLGGSATRFVVRVAQDRDAVVVVATGVAPRIVPFLPSFTVRAEARAFDEGRGATMTRTERGSAIVEMAVLGSLVFGVLIHVLVVFGALHRATLATSAAAREYGRSIVVADSEVEAVRRGNATVALTAGNHGLPADALHASAVGWRRRGAVLVVRVRTEVSVASIPFIGSVVPGLTVPVEATHAVRIDRYRSGS